MQRSVRGKNVHTLCVCGGGGEGDGVCLVYKCACTI